MRVGQLSAFWLSVFALSLGIKLALPDVPLGEDMQSATHALGDALARQGFAVRVDRPDLPIITAQHGGCTLTARILDPTGSMRDLQLRKRPRGWRVAYAWRGDLLDRLPRAAMLIEFHRARVLARFRGGTSRTAVVMLTLDPRCSLATTAGLGVKVPILPLNAAGRGKLTRI